MNKLRQTGRKERTDELELKDLRGLFELELQLIITKYKPLYKVLVLFKQLPEF